MTNTFLPGTVRDRIADLMKYYKVSQTDLALKIGCGDSLLSRFLTGKTDKLGDENIIRIARAFNVSTDFLLGIPNVPDNKNYAIDELGLSAQAARNLYAGKANAQVVNYLLESPRFLDLTYILEQYFNDTVAAGYAAQNQPGLINGSDLFHHDHRRLHQSASLLQMIMGRQIRLRPDLGRNCRHNGRRAVPVAHIVLDDDYRAVSVLL